MVRRIASISIGVWKEAAALAVTTILLIGVAYQVPTSLEVELGSRWSSALVARGFYDAEGSYRWSRGRSELVFPDPGATRSARLELLLSGFRPRNTEAPLLLVEAGNDGTQDVPVRTSRRIKSYSFETRTHGMWSSTLSVHLRSDTFSPGGGDERALGIRLHRARLVLPGPTGPASRQLLAGVVLVLLLFFSLPPGRVRLAGAFGLSVALALGYAFSRLYTAYFAPGLALGLSALFLGVHLFPSAARFVQDTLRGSLRALRRGAAALPTRWALAAGITTLLGAVLAFALRPSFIIDLGTGQANALARRFTGYDRAPDGTTFRRPLPDATLDLRDFGWGSPWTLEIRASVESAADVPVPVSEVLVRTNEEQLAAELGREWRTYRFDLAAPGPKWRGGRLLTFPGLGPHRNPNLRVASIRVDRGVSFPSPHALVLLVGSCFLLAAALSACGLAPHAAAAGGAAFGLLIAAGMFFSPAIVTSSLIRAVLGGTAALGTAAFARGCVDALAEREMVPELAPGALALATAGLLVWFLATASPLYVGGHFLYHSSIAEEIWRGKFFLYYFPGPDNMLSHQAQWGNLVVPHPSFYHTVASPLAAFPRETFYLLSKLFLALLLFGVTLSAALMATSAGTRRTGLYAAAVCAGAPTGSQLLGLGHLMTIFGVWAAAMGLGFVVIQERRLLYRREWLIGLALVTICFLSYTGSLLFGSVTLLLAALWLHRSDRSLAVRLITLLLAGWGLALLLYYVHWLAPFLRESLPALVSGTGSDRTIDLGSRLRLVPEKLSYTFGSWLVPLVGALGLGLAQTRVRRVLLVSWVSVLLLFSVFDLFFNFLLKHHYFSLPAVAVGVGLVLQRLERKSLWAGLILTVFLVLIWAMGLAEALRVARGGV